MNLPIIKTAFCLTLMTAFLVLAFFVNDIITENLFTSLSLIFAVLALKNNLITKDIVDSKDKIK